MKVLFGFQLNVHNLEYYSLKSESKNGSVKKKYPSAIRYCYNFNVFDKLKVKIKQDT